ncbi:DUF4132 domain-containing protein, partial [Actinomadura adrarensis]
MLLWSLGSARHLEILGSDARISQLGRETHALSAEQKASGRLARFEGVTVPFGNVLRLERRGWYRGPVDSDGGISCLVRPARDGRYVVVT